MNIENTATKVSTGQNLATVRRPSGRDLSALAKAPRPRETPSTSVKTLRPSETFSTSAKTPRPKQTPETFSDGKLYFLCKTYGRNVLYWRQKFIGLLPEVFKRRLYEKKGFSSIFEFSKKLAGLSEEQVRLVLNLEKRFEKTPALKELLIEGKVSVNKLARIASIAKPENEEFLANQVRFLSKGALETMVRDGKFVDKIEQNEVIEINVENGGNGEVGSKNDSRNSKQTDTGGVANSQIQNGLQKSFFEAKNLPGHDLNGNEKQKNFHDKANSLRLSPEVYQKLLELQQKGTDINKLFLEFLQKREQEIAREKEKTSKKITEIEETKEKEGKPITNHIPVAAERILEKEYGQKCAIKNCPKPAVHIHHLQRFSVSKSHDPYYLVPLCREHHELAHSADVAYHEIRLRRR